MKIGGYEIDQGARYDGPEFDEYCISAKAYLPASRDRTPCITCPLSNLCDAGFKEQVERLIAGEDPSLTACKTFPDANLERDNLLAGLSEEQQAFVLLHVFNTTQEEDHGSLSQRDPAWGEEATRRKGRET